VDGAGIEAVVDRDVARERIINSLLGFDREDPAPSGHVLCPLDRVHTDICAAVDGDNAISVIVTTQIKQLEDHLDFARIMGAALQQLKSNPVRSVGSDYVIVKPIHNESTVVGCRGYESNFSRRVLHRVVLAISQDADRLRRRT
jgi:hypothetical protein